MNTPSPAGRGPGEGERIMAIRYDKDGKIAYRKVEPVSLFRPKDDEVLAAIRQAEEG